MKNGIGILGGTFDPVHLGHLQIADSITQACHLKEVKFVPCKIPVHKQYAMATASQRMEMLRLALENKKSYTIDLREITRETPSYMIETLQSLRQEYPDMPLVLIIGLDNFLNLEKWKNWRHLLNYAHIAVVTRPGFVFEWPGNLEKEFKSKVVADPELLGANTAGRLYFHISSPIDISSSDVRQSISRKKNIYGSVPVPVADYILREKLYSRLD